jgi:hypothetical protein
MLALFGMTNQSDDTPTRKIPVLPCLHTLDLFFHCQVDDCSGMNAGEDVAEAFFRPLNTISPEEFGLNSIKKGIIAFLKETT